MTDWLPLLVVALAAYRITRLVTTDMITEPLRRRIWARWPDVDTVFPNDGTVTLNPDEPAYGSTSRGVAVVWSEDDDAWVAVHPTPIGYLFSCDWCAGIWVSLLVVVPVGLWEGWDWPWLVMVWMAVSAVVGMIATWVE